MTYSCGVSKLTITGSDNGLSPGRCQAIIWTNAGILLIRKLGTNFSEILSEIRIFSLKKMLLKMSSAKWQQICLGLKVLTSPKLTYVNWNGESIFSRSSVLTIPTGFSYILDIWSDYFYIFLIQSFFISNFESHVGKIRIENISITTFGLFIIFTPGTLKLCFRFSSQLCLL